MILCLWVDIHRSSKHTYIHIKSYIHIKLLVLAFPSMPKVLQNDNSTVSFTGIQSCLLLLIFARVYLTPLSENLQTIYLLFLFQICLAIFHLHQIKQKVEIKTTCGLIFFLNNTWRHYHCWISKKDSAIDPSYFPMYHQLI